MVMLGFKWPPEAGAAANMNKLNPRKLSSDADKVTARGEASTVARPELPAPKRKVRRQVAHASIAATFHIS
jgi:hypothetical protein